MSGISQSNMARALELCSPTFRYKMMTEASQSVKFCVSKMIGIVQESFDTIDTIVYTSSTSKVSLRHSNGVLMHCNNISVSMQQRTIIVTIKQSIFLLVYPLEKDPFHLNSNSTKTQFGFIETIYDLSIHYCMNLSKYCSIVVSKDQCIKV